jgi:predicted RNA binding protein YcfA (HicA-like mRNA interferase family)
MLADIALSQAKEIMKALKEQGFTVFRGMQQ